MKRENHIFSDYARKESEQRSQVETGAKRWATYFSRAQKQKDSRAIEASASEAPAVRKTTRNSCRKNTNTLLSWQEYARLNSSTISSIGIPAIAAHFLQIASSAGVFLSGGPPDVEPLLGLSPKPLLPLEFPRNELLLQMLGTDQLGLKTPPA